MDNLRIYNNLRGVPANAQKPIQGGRLKGMTDINPMWRLKALTEQFGPCGIGWKYTIEQQWLETGANGEIAAFVNINLFVSAEGRWSEAIPGTGGSMFVAKEKSGLYTSDECYKMALTDAISVACKALGMGADIYWQSDRTKYDSQPGQQAAKQVATTDQVTELQDLIKETNSNLPELLKYYKVKTLEDMTPAQYGQCKKLLLKKREQNAKS
ncbi:MAG: hypothetical protein ACOYJ1_13805 [Peptococcales bacterium]